MKKRNTPGSAPGISRALSAQVNPGLVVAHAAVGALAHALVVSITPGPLAMKPPTMNGHIREKM